MTVIENDFLKVPIRNKGGELTSLYNKVSGVEHLWQADPNIWPWHAPNLFPVVGGLINNELLVNGKTYPMKRHGFHCLIRTTRLRFILISLITRCIMP